MWSRYWNFTTCIRCDDLMAIEQAITNLLEEEGFLRLSQLPPLFGSLEELQAHHPWDQSCRPWIVSLFAGQEGWTIIKTWPTELFCHRVIDDYCHRLPVLTLRLGCDAFHLSVYGDIFGFLLEADARGNNYLTGTFGSSDNYFYQLPIDSRELIEQFSLLEVPESFQAALQINKAPEIVRKEAQYEQIKSEKNPDKELLEQLWEDVVSRGHTERIDHALKKAMKASECWYFCDLAYYVYADPEKLVAAEAHLLYFRPPFGYKAPDSEIMTEFPLDDLFGLEEIDD